jgi:pimeloyl-ACP methyl ester carboxylesterase/3-oxoacyl-[acyl-carrier-protein] synthase III
MKYTKVFIKSFGYELAPHVVTSAEIETRLAPFFETVGFVPGQLEALTGIKERRFWDVDHTLAEHAAVAGQRAIDQAGIDPADIGALCFCGVGQDGFEPATSCSIAHALNLGPKAHVYDIKNACLGMVTGMVHVANEIQLGNIKAGLVTSCETARQIVDATIDEINTHKTIEFYKEAVATMTGGSGAAAILLTDGTLGDPAARHHAVMGGVLQNDIRHHRLCHWGFEEKGMPTDSRVIMRTEAQGVLDNGVALAKSTYESFKEEMNLPEGKPDKFIAHQVGEGHHQRFYATMNIDRKKDFITYPFLGNTGSVALPITAAIADERGFLTPGDYCGLPGRGLRPELLFSGGGMVSRIINGTETGTTGFEDLYPFAPKTFEICGHDMSYLDEGSGSPVLMVHGNPTWSFYFRRLVQGLSDTHRTIVPDHIGCGLSDKPAPEAYDYTLARRVADLDALVSSLALKEKISLVVHDWGGMIGLAWALDHLDRVDRLVITNTSGFFLPADKRFPAALWLIKYLAPFAEPAVLGGNVFARGALVLGSETRLPAKVKKGLTAPYNSWKNRIATLKFVQDIPITCKDKSWDVVAKVDKGLTALDEDRLMFLWGLRDFVFDKSFLNEFKRRFPGARTHAYEDAGHYLFEDKPAETLAQIRSFLS